MPHYRRKDKNSMVILTDADKALDKIQHSFTIKMLKKLGIRGIYLNTIQAKYERPTANVMLNSEKLESFPSKIRNKARMPTPVTSIQLSSRSHGQSS